MKNQISPTLRSIRGFTLVEMLVVMAVIAVLAAMLFPAGAAIKRKAAINRARTELRLVAVAIESYKGNLNHYPPDNPGNPAGNQLYYELLGTTNSSPNVYELDSGRSIANVSTFFGPKVTGFVNVSRGGGDEVQKAKNYGVGLKPSQYLEITNGTGQSAIILGVATKGTLLFFDAEDKSINPFRYVSTNPTNNHTTYDLWVDIIVGGKTNRISNWSERADPVGD